MTTLVQMQNQQHIIQRFDQIIVNCDYTLTKIHINEAYEKNQTIYKLKILPATLTFFDQLIWPSIQYYFLRVLW